MSFLPRSLIRCHHRARVHTPCRRFEAHFHVEKWEWFACSLFFISPRSPFCEHRRQQRRCSTKCNSDSQVKVINVTNLLNVFSIIHVGGGWCAGAVRSAKFIVVFPTFKTHVKVSCEGLAGIVWSFSSATLSRDPGKKRSKTRNILWKKAVGGAATMMECLRSWETFAWTPYSLISDVKLAFAAPGWENDSRDVRCS